MHLIYKGTVDKELEITSLYDDEQMVLLALAMNNTTGCGGRDQRGIIVDKSSQDKLLLAHHKLVEIIHAMGSAEYDARRIPREERHIHRDRPIAHTDLFRIAGIGTIGTSAIFDKIRPVAKIAGAINRPFVGVLLAQGGQRQAAPWP